MLEELKAQVCEANRELVRSCIVIYTWGNVSGIDRDTGLVVIKPSGIDYSVMIPDDMVIVNSTTGDVVEGKWKPSSDTKTHIELYKSFPEIGGISHTHSANAVAFAQAAMDIPALGTTHADYFYGSIPCTRELSEEEVDSCYEKNTGKVIVECLNKRRINPSSVPGVIVRNHGPFTWGKDPVSAVFHSVVLEKVAEMGYKTLQLNPNASLPQCILEKHYRRKHGSSAYYGQQ